MTAVRAPEEGLRIRGLSVVYGTGSRPNHALRDVSLEVPRGEMLVILGPNGSGKTTLLSAVSEPLDATVTGEVSWRGRPLLGIAAHSRAKTLTRVYQDPLLGSCAHLTLREHCRLAGLSARTPVSWDDVSRSLASSGAALDPDQQIRTLSGGQRQLFTLLLATGSKPELLLLDEPASALDHRYTGLVHQAIEEFSSISGGTTLLITHDLDEALRFASRLVVLDSRGSVHREFEGSSLGGLSRDDLSNCLAQASVASGAD